MSGACRREPTTWRALPSWQNVPDHFIAEGFLMNRPFPVKAWSLLLLATASGVTIASTAAAQFQTLPYPGGAISVAYGSTEYIVGTDNNVYSIGDDQWIGGPGSSYGSGLNAVQIAVGPNDTQLPWIVTKNGTVEHFTFGESGDTWVPLPNGCATQIAVGASDLPWVIGCDSLGEYGNGIHQWNGSTWVQASGAAMQIGVAPDTGIPWVVNAQNTVFRWNGSAFIALPAQECATSIGVGPYDDAWVTSCNGMGTFIWLGDRWLYSSDVNGTRIASAPDLAGSGTLGILAAVVSGVTPMEWFASGNDWGLAYASIGAAQASGRSSGILQVTGSGLPPNESETVWADYDLGYTPKELGYMTVSSSGTVNFITTTVFPCPSSPNGHVPLKVVLESTGNVFRAITTVNLGCTGVEN
jgi:hypothetical protein